MNHIEYKKVIISCYTKITSLNREGVLLYHFFVSAGVDMRAARAPSVILVSYESSLRGGSWVGVGLIQLKHLAS